MLPRWAVERIRQGFGAPANPAPLIHTVIGDTATGMDARARCTTTREEHHAPRPNTLLLAELHPDTLPAADAIAEAEHTIDDGWPGFLYRAHHFLRRGGFLLLATRQRRVNQRLTDPLGALVACARTAGFTYLQHIVIIHGHADSDHLVATPPDPTVPQLHHSDLLLFDSQPAAESLHATSTCEGTRRR